MSKAWLSWRAIPSHEAAVSIKTWGSRARQAQGSRSSHPRKTPPWWGTHPPEKAANRGISSVRLRLEHAMGGGKRYRMVQDKRRLVKDGMRANSMETYCGLQNFRLQYRPWTYAD
jgi:hypothetical protein